MAFISENYLLTNQVAIKIYHMLMGELPIIDYHNHLEAKEIYEDVPFENITQMWLASDHYKWRLMRAGGIEERFITGDESDYSKFVAFASTMPHAIGNPVYHWTQLELKNYFGIDELLNEKTANFIWHEANQRIKSTKLSPKKLIRLSNVEKLCTTNDPVESLIYHKMLASSYTECVVIPTFRPDRAMSVDTPDYLNYLKELETVSQVKIDSLETLVLALKERATYFHEAGCGISDHSLENYDFEQVDQATLELYFAQVLRGEPLNQVCVNAIKTHLLFELSKIYQEKNWIVQIHIGAIRNNSTYLYATLGANCGNDSIDDGSSARSINQLLNHMVPVKMILYHLNDAAMTALATTVGNFQGGVTPGQIQLGPAWWFNDHKAGIEHMLSTLSTQGLLGRFVGMVTDSRSFLSFSRHEYFRRILANLLGKWVEEGNIPDDDALLTDIVRNISYYNIKSFMKAK